VVAWYKPLRLGQEANIVKPPKTLSETDEDDLRVVSVRNALRLLNTSRTTLYRRLRAGELAGFADGGRRKITIASIKQYIARRCFEETSLREAKKLLRDARSMAEEEQPSP
jgi:excisionase family DNA binding protein